MSVPLTLLHVSLTLLYVPLSLLSVPLILLHVSLTSLHVPLTLLSIPFTLLLVQHTLLYVSLTLISVPLALTLINLSLTVIIAKLLRIIEKCKEYICDGEYFISNTFGGILYCIETLQATSLYWANFLRNHKLSICSAKAGRLGPVSTICLSPGRSYGIAYSRHCLLRLRGYPSSFRYSRGAVYVNARAFYCYQIIKRKRNYYAFIFEI